MTGPTAPRFLTTTKPPPTEKLAKLYFQSLMLPVPVGTRVPSPAETADTINGFLRVEAGGGVQRPSHGLEQLFWDVSVILHAYANNSQEALAEEIIGQAVAWGSNAQGTSTSLLNGDTWYVTYSNCAALAVRKADPLVNMTRYRAMVTWRIPGLPVQPGDEFLRYHPPAGQHTDATNPPAHADGPRLTAPRRTPVPRGPQIPNAPRPTRRR